MIHNIFTVLLFIVAIGFLIFGIDDLIFDVIYWFRIGYRAIFKRYPPITVEHLEKEIEKPIAILIACWNEDDVIADMLTHTTDAIYYQNYRIFIGVYPNDLATQQEILKVQQKTNKVEMVVNNKPGPTTKADNLNVVMDYIRIYEKTHNITFEIYVMDDAEDIIHPLCLKLFNHLIPRKDMVQIPVIPMPMPWYYWTHWVYSDEFAETHTKTLYARETFRGLVPSAGVGTAFSKRVMDYLAALSSDNRIFNEKLLTEDYALSLKLRNQGIQGIFAQQRIKRIVYRKRWFFFGKLVPRVVKERIAIHGFFPTEYKAAIKQRSRWITGITLQQWKETAWEGDWRTKYSLVQDRKALISYIFTFLGYIVFLYFVAYYFIEYFHVSDKHFPPLIEQSSWLWNVLIIDLVLMLQRLLEKMIAVARVYTVVDGILALPRTLYAGIINFHALLSAVIHFFVSIKKKRKILWKKTAHTFPPQDSLQHYKYLLGDLLFQNRLVSANKLKRALAEQMVTKEKIGQILLRNGDILEEQLNLFLAKSHHIDILHLPIIDVPSMQQMENQFSYNAKWLLNLGLVPIAWDQKQLILCLHIPPNQEQRQEVYQRFPQYSIIWKYVTSDTFKEMLRQVGWEDIPKQPKKIGELLIEAGIINDNQLVAALREQEKTHKKLGQILIESHLISENDLYKLLAIQCNSKLVVPDSGKLPSKETLQHHIIGQDLDFLLEEQLLPIQLEIKPNQKMELTIASLIPVGQLKRQKTQQRFSNFNIIWVLMTKNDFVKCLNKIFDSKK